MRPTGAGANRFNPGGVALLLPLVQTGGSRPPLISYRSPREGAARTQDPRVSPRWGFSAQRERAGATGQGVPPLAGLMLNRRRSRRVTRGHQHGAMEFFVIVGSRKSGWHREITRGSKNCYRLLTKLLFEFEKCVRTMKE
jgi:hypothetical protein